MTNRTVMAVVCGGALLAMSAPAEAQYWGRGDEPRDGVCFYKDRDFHGDYFCARVGENQRDLSKDMNDKITSLRLFGNAQVEVFQDARYEGRSTRFDGDVHDLKREGWNDLISSFRVEYSSSRDGHNRYDGGHGNNHNRNRNTYTSSEAERIVRRAYQDVLDRDPDDVGMRTYRSRLMDDGWTESEVRDALRKSPEYRQKSQMTYSKAQDIVARAYRNVLNREPDAAGASGHINKVMHDHWTQQDVERELRKSPEYRNKH